jgi:hypothetical protein
LVPSEEQAELIMQIRKLRSNPNPFLIRDGFKIYGSITKRDRITLKEELYPIYDIAEVLEMPVSSIEKLVEMEEIPHIRFGDAVLFPWSEISEVDPDHLHDVLGSMNKNPVSGKTALGLLAVGLGAGLLFWPRG